ncbi:MAG TPA: NUDIX domain-containing protein [Candidatus Saccharimonadales bacterium]|nr:NUDIX domain-containing protein [Candidatus Saccharimonadales bacterium]
MAEPKFISKPGQVDYTNIRYAPALNVVVTFKGKVLLVKRSADLRLYPNVWASIAGFLDDNQSIEQKAYEELHEELGLTKHEVISLQRGSPLLREDETLDKTWLIVPVLARVTTGHFQLDWEASQAQWFDPDDIAKLKPMLLPELDKVIGQFFP